MIEDEQFTSFINYLRTSADADDLLVKQLDSIDTKMSDKLGAKYRLDAAAKRRVADWLQQSSI